MRGRALHRVPDRAQRPPPGRHAAAGVRARARRHGGGGAAPPGGEVGLHGSFAVVRRTAPRWPPSSPGCGPRRDCRSPGCASTTCASATTRRSGGSRRPAPATTRASPSARRPGSPPGIARPFRPWIVGEERPADLTLLPAGGDGHDAPLAPRPRRGGARASGRCAVLDRVRDGRRPRRPALAQHLPRRRPRARLRPALGRPARRARRPRGGARAGRRAGGARRRGPTCAGGGWCT